MKSEPKLGLRLGTALFGIVLCALFSPNSAKADSGAYDFGQVITVRGCPQVYVVAEKNGFSIVRLVTGPQIQERDILAGNLERVGLVHAQNVTRNNQQIELIVEDILLSRTQFGSHLARFCGG